MTTRQISMLMLEAEAVAEPVQSFSGTPMEIGSRVHSQATSPTGLAP